MAVSGVKLHGEGRSGMEDDAFDRIARRSSRISSHFNVAESVEGEMWLKNFRSTAAQDVSIGCIARCEIVGVEFSVGFKHFAKAQPYLASGGTGDAQPLPTHHILPKIEDVNSWRRIVHRLRPQRLFHLNRLIILGDERSGRRWRGDRRLPV